MVGRHLKKLLILGATGRTGQHLVNQALDGGHEVTVAVRTTGTLPNHPRLRLVIAPVTETGAALTDAVHGQDGVISALGRGNSFKADMLMQRSVPVIIEAMQSAGVRRFIFTSAIGVGAAFQDAPLFSRTLIRLLLQDIYKDKAVGEELIRRSGLDWTIVQPAGLTYGPLTGKYRVGERLKVSGIPMISRADVAHFLLGELDDPAYVGRIARIAY
jgi:putative NADH-flavin reductase